VFSPFFCSFYSRQLEQWLQMLLPVICSAFRPSSSNKHRVLFDRMFSTFIRRSPPFSGAGSGSVGHQQSLSVLEQLLGGFSSLASKLPPRIRSRSVLRI